MSNVSIILDQVIVKLGELFPNKTRIPMPYSLTDNNKNFLSDGYGLIIGSASYEQLDFCNRMISQSISVVFTREVFRTDSDVVVIDDIVKSISEDINSVQGLFYAYNELDIEENIAKIDITSISSVESIQGDKQNFLTRTAEFNFYIREQL
jgi:hypothetical protein